MNSTGITGVREFWNANPCQSDLSEAADRRAYFEEVTRNRYKAVSNCHIPAVANFEAYKGKDVLEIGVGVGTDGFEFAKRGARYCGVDLTPASISLASERFQLFGVEGTFRVANAEERIPFEDNSFDHIYSWGVIHHSPNTESIVAEMYRVLRPGGTVQVMLYNRSSINYYVEIMFLRKLFRLMLYPKWMPRVLSRLTGFEEWKLAGHRERLLKGSTSKEEWISMNTDGPFCPLAKVYNHREGAELFKQFRSVSQEVWGFDSDHWPFVRRVISDGLVQWLGRRWGWHRVVAATK
jgi:ubiquinone/menaquinone biosynthesis C-methylase UbiE